MAICKCGHSERRHYNNFIAGRGCWDCSCNNFEKENTMTNKFEAMINLMNNPPKTKELTRESAEFIFKAAQEMEKGMVLGVDLLREWLEDKSIEDTVKRIDVLSTAALAVISYKKIAEKLDDVPEPLKDMMMQAIAVQEMANMDAQAITNNSLSWMSGFLIGLAFHKYGINCKEES